MATHPLASKAPQDYLLCVPSVKHTQNSSCKVVTVMFFAGIFTFAVHEVVFLHGAQKTALSLLCAVQRLISFHIFWQTCATYTAAVSGFV